METSHCEFPQVYELDKIDLTRGWLHARCHESKPFTVAEGDTVAPAMARFIGERFSPLETSGDGACSLHAVFGSAANTGRLFAPEARRRARRLLGPSMSDAADRGGQSGAETIGASLWSEFLIPFQEGSGGAEAIIFVNSLKKMLPELFTEAFEKWRLSKEFEGRLQIARQERHCASRDFFTYANEVHLVRHVALYLGLVPNTNEIRGLTRDELDQVILAEEGFNTNFLEEAFSVHDGGLRLVRGSRDVFPPDGPSCKYTALFDARPCFDALREAFLIATSPLSSTDRFELLVRDQLGTPLFALPEHSHIVASAIEFIDRINNAASDFVAPSHAPEHFAKRAWPAYVDAFCNDGYYLSVDELLRISGCFNRSVVVVKDTGDRFQYEGAVSGAGPIVFAKIRDYGRSGAKKHKHVETWKCLKKTNIDQRPLPATKIQAYFIVEWI